MWYLIKEVQNRIIIIIIIIIIFHKTETDLKISKPSSWLPKRKHEGSDG